MRDRVSDFDAAEALHTNSPPASERRVCLLVLGMHRSGTSALTRVLSLAGAKLPTRLMGAGASNETGHWEPEALNTYHERLLRQLGSAWSDWGQLNFSCLAPGRREAVKEDIAAIVAHDYQDAPMFVIKEPRICRFTPLFLSALQDSGLDVLPIIALRNPLEVIESLKTRDGMGRANAALLWLRHVLDAEIATRGSRRSVTSYEGLLSDWPRELGRIAEQTAIRFPYSPDEIAPDVEAFLNRKLRHHMRHAEDVLLDPILRGWVSDAYEAMRILVRSPNNARALAQLDDVRESFDRATPTLKSLCADLATTADARVAAEQQRANQLDSQLLRIGQELKAARDEAKAASERVEHVHCLYKSSTSWALTAPLRRVRRAQLVAGEMLQIAFVTLRLGGGLKSTARKGLKVWRREGSSGVVRRLRYAATLAPQSHSLVAASANDISTRREREIFDLQSSPQFLNIPEHPVRAGWYRLLATIVSGTPVRPRLYFDFGDGYSEWASVAAPSTWKSDHYEALFYLPRDACGLLFDLKDDKTAVEIKQITLRTLRPHRRLIELARLGLNRLFQSSPLQLTRDVAKYRALRQNNAIIDLRRYLAVSKSDGSYDTWIERHDYNDLRDRDGVSARIAALTQKPLISVVMPVYNTPRKLLDEAIQSVVDQVYPHWELCVANDASTKAHVKPQLDKWSARDNRIKIMHRPENGHICHATNSAFELATGQWIALLDHDDILRPHALAEVALALDAHPSAALVYSDEDKIDGRGRRYDANFKPDFSPELFCSMNYLNHLTVHRSDLVRKVGGWRPGYEGSQDYDINLRIIEQIDRRDIVHIPKVLYHWRAVEGSTARSGSEKNYPYKAGFRALEEHLTRTGQDARVLEAPGVPFYRISHNIPTPQPLVSLIIPTKDRVHLLRMAIGSILEKTNYETYEIIVMDNNSEKAETFAYFEEISQRANVRVIGHPHPFNFPAINNAAVRHAKGEIVGLINNDIEVITPDWLTEMVSWAQLDRVGCVGAKLYYTDDTVQHAGVVLGIGGVAGHAHKHAHRHSLGYISRLVLHQNLSAVTAACLLVRKSVYEEVGGLDEVGLTVAFNDVDFCLKVREAGYDNIWTPFAELYHHESASRGREDTPEKQARFAREFAVMTERWGDNLKRDPYYSPNLTLDREDFSIRSN